LGCPSKHTILYKQLSYAKRSQKESLIGATAAEIKKNELSKMEAQVEVQQRYL
jgi:hypothetical protein